MSQYRDQRAAIEQLTEEAEKMLRASSDEYAQAVLERYVEFSKRIQADLTLIINNIAEDGYADYSVFQKFSGDAQMLKALSDQLESLNADVTSGLTDSMIQQYKNAYNRSAWALDETTPPSIDVNYQMKPDGVIREFVSSEWNGAMFSQRIGAINDAMARDIQTEVTQGLLSGDSVREIAKRISDVIGDEDSDYMYRAKMIATTETQRATNLARNAFLDENEKYLEDWYWVSRSIASPRICEDCAERSEKTYDEVKEIAPTQDHSDLDPPIHPRCACSWMGRPKKWKDLLGPELSKGMDDRPWWQMSYRDTDGEIVPAEHMEYDDWKEKYLNDSEV